jgi:hypothetical protein
MREMIDRTMTLLTARREAIQGVARGAMTNFVGHGLKLLWMELSTCDNYAEIIVNRYLRIEDHDMMDIGSGV